MGCLGNVIWFLCGGLWQGLAWPKLAIFEFRLGGNVSNLLLLPFFLLEKKFSMAVMQFQLWQTLYGS